MHDTSYSSGNLCAENYGTSGMRVVDIGGKDVNGSLRAFFVERGMEYICVDIEEDASVDIVIKPADKLPFETGSIDLIVSTSCFEHDPCFWMTFREMTRIVKMSGYIYVSAPTNGEYHGYPGDSWRFYADAGQSLAYWSGYQMTNDTVYPVKVVEAFHIMPQTDKWIDFVCIWKRVEERDTEIVSRPEIYNNVGILQHSLNRNGFQTRARVGTN